MSIQQHLESVPGWMNWLVIGGTWAVSFLQPLALLVTIVWGGMQIYIAYKKKPWRRK